MYEHSNIHLLDCILIKKVISIHTLLPTVVQSVNIWHSYFLLIMQKFTIINFKIPFVNQTRGFRISL